MYRMALVPSTLPQARSSRSIEFKQAALLPAMITAQPTCVLRLVLPRCQSWQWHRTHLVATSRRALPSHPTVRIREDMKIQRAFGYLTAQHRLPLKSQTLIRESFPEATLPDSCRCRRVEFPICTIPWAIMLVSKTARAAIRPLVLVK
jgi:hypothetical protein